MSNSGSAPNDIEFSLLGVWKLQGWLTKYTKASFDAPAGSLQILWDTTKVLMTHLYIYIYDLWQVVVNSQDREMNSQLTTHCSDFR